MVSFVPDIFAVSVLVSYLTIYLMQSVALSFHVSVRSSGIAEGRLYTALSCSVFNMASNVSLLSTLKIGTSFLSIGMCINPKPNLCSYYSLLERNTPLLDSMSVGRMRYLLCICCNVTVTI